MHLSLNNIGTLYLNIFRYIFVSCHIDFMVSGGNWLMKLP